MILILLTVFVVVHSPDVFAQNPTSTANEENRDERCPIILPVAGVNFTWLESVNKWYLVGTDSVSFDDTLGILISVEAVEAMTETQKKQACVTQPSFGRPDRFFIQAAGYNPVLFRPYLNPVNVGAIDWKWNVQGEDLFVGTTTILATDNKSYFVTHDPWPKIKLTENYKTDRGLLVLSVNKQVDQSVHNTAIEKMKEFFGMHSPKRNYLVLDNSLSNCV